MKKYLVVLLVIALLATLLSGCGCKHEWEDATCKDPKTCEKCGQTTGEPTSHKWKDATCETPKTCEKCNQTTGEPTSHKWKDATCEDPKTCEKCGQTTGEPTSHKWKDATCETPKTCEKCGQTTGEPLGHIYSQATCTEAAKCSVCDQIRGEPLGHKFSEASCTDPVKCVVCNFVSSQPTGHDFSKAPCDTDTKCAVCGASNKNPLAHNYSDATCEKPAQCSFCGLTQGNPLGHNWKNNVCTQCKVTRPDALSHVLSSEKLTIVTSPDYPPFESLENDQVVGIEPDILKQVAAEMGVVPEFVQMGFDSALSGIQSGQYTCAASGIIVTSDRKKNMLFSSAYYNAAQVIVVPKGSAIQTKADLAGKTVSVQTGTTAEMICYDEGITHQAYMANADAKYALTLGKVDAWVVDGVTAQHMIKNHDGLVILETHMFDEPYAFAFPLGSETLVAEINKHLDKFIADGTIADIFAKYGEPYYNP